MAFTSDRPITVDGVRLDTLAWNIEAIKRATAARRDASVSVPGRDGDLASLNDDLEPATLGLDMFVRGTDHDGGVPAAGQRDTMRANLDELVHLFGTRHRLIEVIQQTGPGEELVNLLDRPRAETDDAGYYPNDTQWVRTRVTDVKRSGTSSIRYNANDGGNFVASVYAVGRPGTRVPVTAAKGYSMGYWVRTSSPMDVRAELYWYNASSNHILTTSGQIVRTVANVWTFVKIEDSRAPAGALSAHTAGWVRMPDGAASATTDYAWFDDSTMVEAPTAINFTGATATDATYAYVWDGVADQSTSRRLPLARRRALTKVVDVIAPEMNGAGGSGRFSAALVIPSGTWEDALPTSWTSAVITSGVAQEVTTLQGAVERITDAVILVQGPATAPRVTDPATGAYVALGTNLAAGQLWRINVGTWNTRYGAVGASGWSEPSADDRGTDGQALTTYGGMLNQSAFLPLTPTRTPLDPTRRVSLALTAGGVTTSTRLFVAARRKYAL